MMGLPYAFASHFAPSYLKDALKLYKDSFQPSEQLKEPYAIACVNVVAADTTEEAERLATSLKLFFLNVIRGGQELLKPPVDNLNAYWNPYEKAAVDQMLEYTFIGDSTKISHELQAFLDETQVDEIMVCSHIYDHEARVRSYEIMSQSVKSK